MTNDLISREALKKAIAKSQPCCDVWIDIIDNAPTVEPKQGEWVLVTNARGGNRCSKCNEYAPSYKDGTENLSKYCPNCGAKMKGGAE